MRERRLGLRATIVAFAATFFLLGMAVQELVQPDWIVTTGDDMAFYREVSQVTAPIWWLALVVLYGSLLVAAVCLWRIQDAKGAVAGMRATLIPLLLGLLGAVGVPWWPLPAAGAVLAALLFGISVANRPLNAA